LQAMWGYGMDVSSPRRNDGDAEMS
jgi:hypothetical protein